MRGLAHAPHEIGCGEVALSPRPPLRIQRGLEKGHCPNAGNLCRILKRQKHPFERALIRLELQQIFSVEEYLAGFDLIVRLAGNNVGQGRLTRAVWPHDRRDLACVDAQAEAVENRLVLDRGAEILNFKHCASTLGWRQLGQISSYAPFEADRDEFLR